MILGLHIQFKKTPIAVKIALKIRTRVGLYTLNDPFLDVCQVLTIRLRETCLAELKTRLEIPQTDDVRSFV